MQRRTSIPVLLLGAFTATGAAALEPGDVLLPVRASVLEVDPATGDRTAYSHGNSQDQCGGFQTPFVCCNGFRVGQRIDEREAKVEERALKATARKDAKGKAEPKPTKIPKPTAEPKPTKVPKPTAKPKPTKVPNPTKVPKPTPTP